MFADPALSGTCGPVAQLGARMNGIHEVTGSIPVWSTNSPFRPPLVAKSLAKHYRDMGYRKDQ